MVVNDQIVTKRLILRSLQENDGPSISQATCETWTDLNKWMRWATNFNKFTNAKECVTYANRCHNWFL